LRYMKITTVACRRKQHHSHPNQIGRSSSMRMMLPGVDHHEKCSVEYL
jgi:hypothetical protein